jgi:hypothetical protein
MPRSARPRSDTLLRAGTAAAVVRRAALVLGDGRWRTVAAAAALNEFTNVTLLDRPTSTQSLVSALLAALRARRRQYQTRDQLEALLQAQQDLQQADQRKRRVHRHAGA